MINRSNNNELVRREEMLIDLSIFNILTTVIIYGVKCNCHKDLKFILSDKAIHDF